MPELSPVAWMTAERLSQQVIWLVLFAILAPILGPRPYGEFAIVMVFVGLCDMALLQGSSEALLSVGEPDHLHSSTVNISNAVLALVITAATVASAPAIAKFYGEPELKELFWVLSPVPLLSSLTSTPLAVLRRSLLYKRLAIRSIAGLSIGGIFGIVLALLGVGVWALIFQLLAQRVTEFIIMWATVPEHLGFRWSHRHFKELRPTAQNVLIAQIMATVSGQVPRLIIGYVLGTTTLGLFTLATRLVDISTQLAVQPGANIGRVEMQRFEAGSASFEKVFVKMVEEISFLAFPLLLGAAAITPLLFSLWLDKRWFDAILPTQLMLISGVPLVLSYCVDASLLASRSSSTLVRTNGIQSLTLCATIFLFAPLGLNITCVAVAIRPWLVAPVSLYFLRKYCGVSFGAIWPVQAVPLFGAVLMAIFVALTTRIAEASALPRIPFFVGLVAAGVMIYFAYLYWFFPDRLKVPLRSIFAVQRKNESSSHSKLVRTVDANDVT